MAENAKVSIMPLGGLGELGKNMMVLRVGRELVIIDAGSAFPDEEMLGVDTVIPDLSYVVENKDKIKGIILTHGHEDHIGALPYLLRQINVPVYGTELTLAMARLRLREHGLERQATLVSVQPRQGFKVGNVSCELIRVNHNLADACALAVKTPLGWVVHTGDFKVDYTPVDGAVADLERFAELGRDGVALLMSDSTNAELRGHTASERLVGERLDQLIRLAPGRIIASIFDTDLYRLLQILNCAAERGRKVVVHSSLLEQAMAIVTQVGQQLPLDHVVSQQEAKNVPGEEIVVVTVTTTGAPLLANLTGDAEQKVRVEKNDTIILAGSAVPGGEKAMNKAIDLLYRQGAHAVFDAIPRGAMAGHAGQDELKLMISLTKPRSFLPIHGEFRHLVHHRDLAVGMGCNEEQVFILENGYTLDLTEQGAMIGSRVQAGKILVDGLGVGDVGNIVLRDRKQLSQDGLIIAVVTISKENGALVAGPDIVSRGFVYVKESELLIDEARERVRTTLDQCRDNRIQDWPSIKGNVRDTLSKFLFEKTRRRPMVLPIIMEV
ncbi:MAG: ribonuclease J [Bacillota bacterium]